MKKCYFAVLLVLLSFSLLLSACATETPVEAEDSSFTFSEPTEPVHTHSFREATCDTPKVCAICGLTEGGSLGHSWVDATCTTPKSCSRCEKTEGYPASHTYDAGQCTVCGKKDLSDPESITVWIPTNGGTKYHTNAGCSNMENPQKTTKAAAIEAGFEACARCH